MPGPVSSNRHHYARRGLARGVLRASYDWTEASLRSHPVLKPASFAANNSQNIKTNQQAGEAARQQAADLASFGDYCRGDNPGVGSSSLFLHFRPNGHEGAEILKAQVFWPARHHLPAGRRGGHLSGRPGNPCRLESRRPPLQSRPGPASRTKEEAATLKPADQAG